MRRRDAVIAVRELTVDLGGRRVVCGITCDFQAPGTVVVGPAGSGKTTLLKALCGLVPAEGTITVGDSPLPRDAEGLKRARQAFGFVFQSDALFDDRTALDNVAFP